MPASCAPNPWPARWEQHNGSAARCKCRARGSTKIHETVHTCSLEEAGAWLERGQQERGEFVLVVSGAAARAPGVDAEAGRVLGLLLEELPLSRAAELAARITGAPRKALYERALALKAAKPPRV